MVRLNSQQTTTCWILFREVFARFGTITSIKVCRDTQSRKSLGYAYINFASKDDGWWTQKFFEKSKNLFFPPVIFAWRQEKKFDFFAQIFCWLPLAENAVSSLNYTDLGIPKQRLQQTRIMVCFFIQNFKQNGQLTFRVFVFLACFDR